MDSMKILMDALRAATPLVFHLTNDVTINDCANITLAIGASPLMSNAREEGLDLVAISSALVLNMGTADAEQAEYLIEAGKAAKEKGIPVVFDPVGVGASRFRNALAQRVLKEVQPDIIKGNGGEISFLAGLAAQQRGVDSLADAEGEAVLSLARQQTCLVMATGASDIISDGSSVWKISGGNAALGRVCGSGCMTTSVCASFAAVASAQGASLAEAALNAGVCMKYAAERAAKRLGRADMLSSFRWAFMDELCLLKDADVLSASKAYTQKLV